jgi:hypothetical protein
MVGSLGLALGIDWQLSQGAVLYRVYQDFKNGFLIYRDKEKGMTTRVRKCIVTELSERVFTECTPTRSDSRNRMRDTGYNCYTSNQVTSYTRNA